MGVLLIGVFIGFVLSFILFKRFPNFLSGKFRSKVSDAGGSGGGKSV